MNEVTSSEDGSKGFDPLVPSNDPLETLDEKSSINNASSATPPPPPAAVDSTADDGDTRDLSSSIVSDVTNEREPLVGFTIPIKRTSSELSVHSRRPFLDHYNDSTKNLSTLNLKYPSGLDFERVVNHFSIEALHERYLVAHHETEPSVSILESGVDKSYSTFQSENTPADTNPRGSISTETLEGSSLPRPPVSETRRAKPHPLGYTGRTAIGWVFSLATGLMTGGISILLASQTEHIKDIRSEYIGRLWKSDQKGIFIFLAYAFSNLALVLFSSALCLYLSPNAVGSGIPEVKAFLNGVRVQRFSSFRLFFVKIFGTILSVSSDLAIGPEGPLVQIGAIMGASCTKLSSFLCHWVPSRAFSSGVWKFVTIDLSYFSTDWERRILVSIGAAAGFSAAFGAPIGGLLFSLEEASTHFHTSMFVKTLSATAIATFLLSVYHGNLSDFSIISMGNYKTPDDNLFLNRVEEFPLYFVVAVAGGTLGGTFCLWWKYLQIWRRRFFPSKQAKNRWKLKEVAFVSLLTSTLMYYIPTMNWPCRPIVDQDELVELTPDAYLDHAHQFDCPRGQINELAAIFFGNREDAIRDILENPAAFQPMTLWVTGIVFFFLMTLTLGIAIPSGVFMPTFLVGSSLGGAAGLVFQSWVSDELSPSIFALLGAAALLSGVQRTTVSICVILVEGTGAVKTLIPVIFTVVVARWVGDRISGHGLYELAMEVNQYPFLELHNYPKLYDIFSVKEIMSYPPITVGPREKAHTIVRLLRESIHNGFPVVDPKTKRFLGLVRRDQLVALLECGIFEEERDEERDSNTRSPTFLSRKGPGGWGSTPMFNLAFHIKDDRFAHLEGDDPQKVLEPAQTSHKAQSSAVSPTRGTDGDVGETATTSALEDDEMDSNAWFAATRKARQHLEAHNHGMADSIHTVEDSMPLPTNRLVKRRPSFVRTEKAMRAGVGLNPRGNVFITWLDKDHEDSWLPIGDVMNLGTVSLC